MTTAVAVVMVPLPAQGHLNQLLHLSRLISGHHIPVYYAATAAHLRQATTRAHKSDLISDYITFHELPTISFENKPPNPNASNRFPSQVMPSLHACTRLREPVLAFVRELSDMYGKVVVIYDSLMSYVVQDIAQRSTLPNSELYCFVSMSAFASCAWEDDVVKEEIDESDLLKDLPSTNGYYPTEFSDFLFKQRSIKNNNCGQIYNSNSVMEGTFLKLLGKTATEKIWGLGPFDLSIKDERRRNCVHNNNACLEWLDRQEAGSVMYVSFGTTTSFPHEQVAEIAKGLERSEHKFVWVLRDADRGNIFDGEKRNLELPLGFEERIKSRGLIVRDWAPQLEILGHLAVGGFVSHCGWNSCLESLSNGVPVAAWPLHSDQPWNAALMTKVLKVGVMVKKWTPSSELVTCLEVESAVRRLMEDHEIRRRAKQLGHDIKNSVKEGGGDTRQEIDCFISRITRPPLI